MKAINRSLERRKRHARLRNTISGTAEHPRLHVFKSHKNFYLQAIDDLSGTTLAAASTLEPEIKGALTARGNQKAAKLAGALLAQRMLAKGIKRVVFDRGGNQYQGAIKAVADAAREGGLKF